MALLIVTKEAGDEIDALYATDPYAAADIDLLIEELGGDDRTLEELCIPQNHYGYQPPFEIKRFGEAQKRGKNIYTAKLRSTTDDGWIRYRVLIGFDAQKDYYYVLAIAHRDHAYDTGDDRFRTLLSRYDDCGIPTYR